MSVRLADFLEGAVDLQLHSSPDIDERKFNDISLARAAVQGGLRAILIKSHQNSTLERAWLVSQVVPGLASTVPCCRPISGAAVHARTGRRNEAVRRAPPRIWLLR